jgi:hypothetical protein
MKPKKKVASLPILVLDSRSRFADLSFHSQPWSQVTRGERGYGAYFDDSKEAWPSFLFLFHVRAILDDLVYSTSTVRRATNRLTWIAFFKKYSPQTTYFTLV